MPEPTLVMLVKFKSALPLDEVLKIAEERTPEFRALAGLHQKYYLTDATTGEVGGLYFWESREALTAYEESELKATISEAYQVEGEPRIEVFRIFQTLRDGC